MLEEMQEQHDVGFCPQNERVGWEEEWWLNEVEGEMGKKATC